MQNVCAIHCRSPCYSTETLEELIDLVSFDDVSGGLREAVKLNKSLHVDIVVDMILNFYQI